MKIRILKASDNLYWYSKYVNEIFNVIRVTPTEYWTREKGMYQAMNFVLKIDSEVVLEG